MRFLSIFFAALLLMWIIVTAAARLAVNEALAKPWPHNLGTIRDVSKRYLPRKTTPEGDALDRAAEAIEDEMTEDLRLKIRDYILVQLAKENDSVEAPPPEIAAFLRDHRALIDAARGAINERIDWEQSVNPDFIDSTNAPVLLTLSRLIGVDALEKARNGERRAWDDLHATYVIAAPLMRRTNPDAMLYALSIIRMANGIARKLPPPVPAWWSEVDRFDARHAVLAAMQASTWSTWRWFDQQRASRGGADLIMSAYEDASAANLINRARAGAEELASMNKCAVDGKAFETRIRPQSWSMLSAFGRITGYDVQRVRLYDFERDATQRVFAIKEHRPLPAASRCADGEWRYREGVLRYSVRIPIDDPVKAVMPQVLRY